MSPSLRRLLVTVAVAAGVLVVGDLVPLPGVTGDLPKGATLGVFALGLTPFLTAYWLVELTALAIPRLSALRHRPAGRATLDRASRVLGLVLATAQAWGIGVQLTTVAGTSVPIVTASLVGGACVQLLAASVVTRAGTMNGLVALVAAGLLRASVDDLRAYVLSPASEPRDAVFAFAGIAVLVFATWAALRGAGALPRSAWPARAGRPYRDGEGTAMHPWVPVPAGSFQAYVIASSLLMLPATLASFGLPVQGLQRALATNGVHLTALLAIACAIGAVLAALMHRPRDVAAFAARADAGLDAKAFETDARRALRRAVGATCVYFVAVVLASSVSRLGGITVSLLTVAFLDLVHGARADARDPDRVVVWEERRAWAVPLLRADLASRGIASETRGAGFLAYLQVFAPYAPAQIVVARADAERAAARLAEVLEGEAGAKVEPATPAAAVSVEPWSPPARTRALAFAALAASVLTIVHHEGIGAPRATGPRAKLEIVRVDDATDPLGDVRDEDLPEGAGLSIFAENVPAGPGRVQQVHYARVVPRDGESMAAARARFASWLASVTVPPDARFGVEELDDYDPDAARSTAIGWRSVLLTGDPVLGTDDVVEAYAGLDSRSADPPLAYVGVTLSSSAAGRFEEATRAWTGRRLAIVVDDVVTSAPVVKSAIAGGRLTVTMGAGDPDKAMAEAKDLARRLHP